MMSIQHRRQINKNISIQQNSQMCIIEAAGLTRPRFFPPSELRVQDQQQETISHTLQKSDHVCVAVFSGQIHGPTVRIVPGLRVRLVLHQQPHRVQVARPGRVVQRGGPGAAVRHVGIRSVVQQHLRHRRAAHHHHLCYNTTTGAHNILEQEKIITHI